ncbi:DUF1646 family protein [Oceanobacillus bengalensis]|uniref:DUF1646 domain-containing protein n=1 Tax=Oceanobacillus bengalensis TaxID=1435466 RepID=A0A494Z3U3_9BACI|nr:DUF1646 family protein [Oceanobacillus bengalensis]RKQ17150.1 DUF1646 domain-containing protein [Oceanobacillus bengalensis]
MTVGLLIILFFVLVLPFFVKIVERNLEVFLFLMGLLAAIVSGVFDKELFQVSLTNPIKITLAVLVAGLLFKWLQQPIENAIVKMSQALNIRLFLGLLIVILGFLSSIITAIIAAIILVSVISILKLDRKTEVQAIVLACFSIGLGAVLTPIGEPLATIAISKLGEDFSYLFHLIGMEIIVAIIAIGTFTFLWLQPSQKTNSKTFKRETEGYHTIIFRSVKIYLFVMGLTLLGAGFEPLVNRYLLDLDSSVLYWINILSAILDNATLAAAEISPEMSAETIRYIILGLIISGGMLIQGNIPNIISANKLRITSKEWAKFAAPFGFTLMLIFFLYLNIFG